MKKKLPFSPTPQASFQLVETFIAYSSSQRGGGLLLDRKKEEPLLFQSFLLQ